MILLKLYIIFLSFWGALKAGILNKPGNKYIPRGYIIDNPKLIIVSFIRWIWVFLYIAQKEDIIPNK